MRQFTMTRIALAAFGAMVATAQAEKQPARPSQAVSAAQQAIEECKARYGGDSAGPMNEVNSPSSRRALRKRPACIRAKPT